MERKEQDLDIFVIDLLNFVGFDRLAGKNILYKYYRITRERVLERESLKNSDFFVIFMFSRILFFTVASSKQS